MVAQGNKYKCRNCSEKYPYRIVLAKAKIFSRTKTNMKTDKAIFRSLCRFLRYHNFEFVGKNGQVEIESFIITVKNGRLKLYSPFVERHYIQIDLAIGDDLYNVYKRMQFISTVIIEKYRPNHSYKPLPPLSA